jgi:hypothetical protein
MEIFFCTEINVAIRAQSFRDKRSFRGNSPGRLA